MLSAVPLLFTVCQIFILLVSYLQLICSRRNNTEEVKQKIIDYLEGKDAPNSVLLPFLLLFLPV